MWRLWAIVAAVSAAGADHRSVTGQNGMVATSHPEASAAAARILERGGNAVDAALAVHFVLAVVEPQHVSIGGGGVMLYKPLDGEAVHVDFREEAPALYHPKTFCRNAACIRDPNCECKGTWPSNERCTGGHATGTPGFPALVALAVRDRLTSLPLSELAAPAIELARNGWSMDDGLYKSIQQYAPQLARDPASRELFLDASGTKPRAEPGELLRNPQLADTLELLVAAPDGFYTGQLGTEFVKAAQGGLNNVTGKYGLLSAEDLHSYRAVYREPVKYEYTTASGHTYLITGSAPPFSGGVAHAQIFNFLEQVEGAEATSARDLGFFMDAQNVAFADRNQYVADPDFVDVDVKTLTSKSYAAQRVKELLGTAGSKQSLHSNEVRALTVPVTPGALSSERGTSSAEDYGTSHMTIIDSKGNIVAMTTTVNMIMGSRVTVPGRGYLLNDELCDFDSLGFDSAGQMTVNAAEGGKRPRRTALGSDSSSLGGKRPRSSMSPTLVVPKDPGHAAFAVLGLGAPGGSDIIGGTANVLRYTLTAPTADDVRELQKHTDTPRAIGKNEPRMGNAVVELALFEDKEKVASLQSWGYNLTHTPYSPPYYVGETYSRVQSAMMWRADSTSPWEFVGAADTMRLPTCTAQAPRSLRGGAAESNSDAVPTCAKKGITYLSDVKGTPNSAWLHSPKMCQMACYINPTCKHFSWKEDSFPGGACNLLGEDVQEKVDEKSYSGPKACASEVPVSAASLANAGDDLAQKANEVGSQFSNQLNQASQDLDKFGKDLTQKANQATSDLSQKANEFHNQVNQVGQDLAQQANQAANDLTQMANQAQSDLTQKTQEFNSGATELQQKLDQFGKDLTQQANQASTGLSNDLSQKAKEFQSDVNKLRQEVGQQKNQVAADLTQKTNEVSGDLNQMSKEFNSQANQLGQDLTQQANKVGDVLTQKANQASSDLSQKADELNDVGKDLTQTAQDAMESAGLQAKEAADQMGEKANEILGSAPGSSGGGGDNTMTYGVIGGIAGALALAGGAYYFMSGDEKKKKKSKRAVSVDAAPMMEEAPEVPQVTAPQAFPQQFQNQVQNMMAYAGQQMQQRVPVPQYYQQVPQRTQAPQPYPAAAYPAGTYQLATYQGGYQVPGQGSEAS